jgi:hypothetical protein
MQSNKWFKLKKNNVIPTGNHIYNVVKEYTFYLKTNKKYIEYKLKNGLIDGKYYLYNIDGEILIDCNYILGKVEYFIDNTQNYKNIFYNINDLKLIIDHKIYFPNSDQISIHYTTENNLINGKYIIYNKNGDILDEIYYKLGKIMYSVKYNVFGYNEFNNGNNEFYKIKKYLTTYNNVENNINTTDLQSFSTKEEL